MRNSYFQNYSVFCFTFAFVALASNFAIAQNSGHQNVKEAPAKTWRLIGAEILSGGLKVNCRKGLVVVSETPTAVYTAESGFADAPCSSNASDVNSTLKIGLLPIAAGQYRASLSLSTVTIESQVASLSPVAALALKTILGNSSQSEDRYFQWMSALVHGTQATGWVDRTYSMAKEIDVQCKTYRPTFASLEIPEGWPGSNRTMECIGGQFKDSVGLRPEVVLSFEEISL